MPSVFSLWEVREEPPRGVSDDLIERAGFLEEMRCVRHDHELAFHLQSLLRFPVKPNDGVIMAPDDQKRRRARSSASPAKSARPPRETTAKMRPLSAAATSAAPTPVLAPK